MLWGRRGHMARVVFVCAFAVATFAAAFEEEGHLFTSASVLYPAKRAATSAPDGGVVQAEALMVGDGGYRMVDHPGDLALVVFCSQLPDQTHEYDAIQVVGHRFAFGNQHAADWLRWVQEDLHGLMGGDAGTLQRCADTVVAHAARAAVESNGNPVDLCALGFAIHLYGDSYAHWRLDSATGALYQSPIGHAADYHEPDLPFYEPGGPHGIGNWERYFEGLARTLRACAPGDTACAPMTRIELTGAAAFQESVAPHESASVIRNFFGSPVDKLEGPKKDSVQERFQQALAQVDRSGATGYPTAVEAPIGGFFSKNKLCDDYVKDAAKTPNGFRPPALSCGAVWMKYAQLAADVLTTAECQSAFVNADDWAHARPDGGYTDD